MSGAAVIVLAAGGSSRMGSPKQMLRVEGQTLIRRAAETALASACAPVIVVVGAYAKEIRSELADLPVTTVANPRWELGMGASIAAGVEALLGGVDHDLDAVVVMLCDQPHVSVETLNRLLTASEKDREAIVASQYAGVCGVPALFPRSLFSDLAHLNASAGGRSLLNAYPDRIVAVPFSEGVFDLDTQDDVQRYIETTGTP